MRENRPSGSEGGAAETNRPSLPLSKCSALLTRKVQDRQEPRMARMGVAARFPRHPWPSVESVVCLVRTQRKLRPT